MMQRFLQLTMMLCLASMPCIVTAQTASSSKSTPSVSTAERFMVGFGAGRSTVDCRLVRDANGKDLSDVRIRVRGSLMFSPYHGNNRQRRQAVNSFDQRLIEEIEKMK